jgi:hypothetical protein
MSQKETLANAKASIEVLFETVTLSLRCRTDYEAQTLFDDLVARIERGDPIQIQCPKP